MKAKYTEEVRIQKIKEAKLRYVKNNPEKRNKSFNDYWKRKRDIDPESWKSQQRTKARMYRQNNLEHYKGVEREKSRVRRLMNPTREKMYNRSRLLGQYGLTQESYDLMFAKQEGKCAICKSYPSAKGLQIDHDHVSGAVRGLLCNGCNLMLGHIEKSISKHKDTLQEIAIYLKLEALSI